MINVMQKYARVFYKGLSKRKKGRYNLPLISKGFYRLLPLVIQSIITATAGIAINTTVITFNIVLVFMVSLF